MFILSYIQVPGDRFSYMLRRGYNLSVGNLTLSHKYTIVHLTYYKSPSLGVTFLSYISAMDPTIESLKREVAVLRVKLNDTEKRLEIKEAKLRTFVRTATHFIPRKVETVVEMRPDTPKSIK